MFEVGEVVFEEEFDGCGGEVGVLEQQLSELGLRKRKLTRKFGRWLREGRRLRLGERVAERAGMGRLAKGLSHYCFEFF
ncbi:MAG: hypothetical protein ACK56F_07615, partial [bacterium]